jgi:maltose alpha-D-glucosyltransferase/alpha-amylase
LLSDGRSNTCIVYGEHFLLKVFRQVTEGVNPELEIGRFLAEKTSFRHMPMLVGAVEYQRSWGEPMTLAVLQTWVPNEGNAWRLTRDNLGPFFERALTGQMRAQDLPLPRQPLLDLVDQSFPRLAQELLGSYLELARLLGQRTAELHGALTSVPEDPNFAPEPFTGMYQRSLYQSARTQARQAFEILGQRVQELPEALREEARKLLGLEGEIVKRARAIVERKITALRIRCHANYHLGEVLYTGKDFVLIGFEGDASRSGSDRRRKRGALRDVATMLRSFQDAALSAATRGNIRPEDVAVLQPWAHFWIFWVWVTFLKAYLETAGQAAYLSKSRGELAMLLDFYLVKTAVQQLRYDVDHFPERLPISVRGLLRLLEEVHCG